MRRTFRTSNDYEMQRNAEVGVFTKPSIFMDMFNQMTEFGKNKGLTGQFTGFQAPRHAKDNGFFNDAGSGTG